MVTFCNIQYTILISFFLFFVFQGILQSYTTADNTEKCLLDCVEDGECQWVSFNKAEGFCILFLTCPLIDTTFVDFTSSQVECHEEPPKRKKIIKYLYIIYYLRSKIWDLRSDIWGLRSEIWCLYLRSEIRDLRLEIWDLRSEVLDLRSWIWGPRSEVLDLRSDIWD